MGEPQRVVVAGGGPAAIEALLALREFLGDAATLELVAPDRDLVVHAYDVIAPFHHGHEHRYPLSEVCADLGVVHVRERLVSVAPHEATVRLSSGAHRSYDALILAVGGRELGTVAGAMQFRGAQDAAALRALLLEAHSGRHRRVAFVVPGGHTWPLPLYELALQTSTWLAARHVDVPLSVVSPESGPLATFGSAVSAEVSALLEARGMQFVSGRAVRQEEDRLLLAGGETLDVHLAIALGRLGGPAIPGLPQDAEGFLPVDEFGRVIGVAGVYAAGDAANFPIKQGGLATQQADVVAETIAAAAGAAAEPSGFRPVLRAVLLTGEEARYIESEIGAGAATATVSTTPLWPYASKVRGRFLAPYLETLDERRVSQPRG